MGYLKMTNFKGHKYRLKNRKIVLILKGLDK